MHFECEERFANIELSTQLLCCVNVWRLIKFKVYTGVSTDIGRYEFNRWMVSYVENSLPVIQL